MNVYLAFGFVFSTSLLAWQEPTGSIEVKVRLKDDTPGLPVVIVDKNIPFCGAEIKDPILLTHQGLVINSVLSLNWKGEALLPDKSDNLRLSTKGCLIEPRIQTSYVGAFLHLRSGDSITHNPHGWLDDKRTVFNLTLTDESRAFKRKLRWPGQYRIDCDTHAWMKAYVLVFDHPYHAVTDTTGKGLIQNIPPGEYQFTIWHEVLGTQTTVLVVVPGKTIVWEPIFALADHRQDKLKPRTRDVWPPKGE